jgi:hypothetical protein
VEVDAPFTASDSDFTINAWVALCSNPLFVRCACAHAERCPPVHGPRATSTPTSASTSASPSHSTSRCGSQPREPCGVATASRILSCRACSEQSFVDGPNQLVMAPDQIESWADECLCRASTTSACTQTTGWAPSSAWTARSTRPATPGATCS